MKTIILILILLAPITLFAAPVIPQQSTGDTLTAAKYNAALDSIVQWADSVENVLLPPKLNIADSIDYVTQYEFDTFLADSAPLSGVAHLLTDSNLFFAYGAGGELTGDTILFGTTQDLVHGHRKVLNDSVEIVISETHISTGDTLDFSYVYGDTLGDSDGTIVAISVDGGLTTTTSFTTSTIPPDNYIWIDVTGVTVARKPILFRADLYVYTKRD